MTTRLILVAAVSVVSTPVTAQILPPAKHAARVRLLDAPRLELATDHLAIVRWITDNPGGSDVHYGVIRYGTNPTQLLRMARSPIRLNRGHRRTIFRVRLDDLEPATTYYYRVACEEGSGKSDGVQSAIYRFTTPASGGRCSANPARCDRPRDVQLDPSQAGNEGKSNGAPLPLSNQQYQTSLEGE